MNLIEGLQEEMNRVREIIKVYDEVPNGAGAFASGMMKHSVKSAEAFISIGDTIGMMEAYKDLKEYEL
jgi:argininosuccinate lyase